MIFGSVCSGIEAASCAWHPLGWQTAFVSEIEPFPCSVLKQHYPEVPNHGDMTKFQEWPDARISVLVGGTPCQSFSVAGLRKGLADPRGNLMLTYLAIADQYRPDWLVWENVPGVLSSNGGRDFASFLRGLAELGYGFAYRILDAQYFGVAQRRRRVFVVGHIGDWRRAAAVLFERHSLQGHPAPRREAGQVTTPTIRSGASNGGVGHGARSGDSKDELIVAQSLRAQANASHRLDTDTYVPVKWPAEVAPALDTTMKKYMGLDNQHINGGGGGLSEVSRTLNAGGMGRQDWETETLIPTNGGGFDVAHAIRTANTSANGHGVAENVAHTIDQAQGQAIAFGWQNSAQQGASASASHTPTLDKSKVPGICAPSLTAYNMDSRSPQSEEQQRIIGAVYKAAMQVRRLTPRECERLQGFPDDYTLVQHRNKPAADGPRYKALGNSMAVPVMAWIGRRIAMVEQVTAGGRDD
jgi:DNA (cytosine-5)-methyltransferase 1